MTATILATTAVQDAGLLALLAEGSPVSDAARSLKREMLRDLGIAPRPEEEEIASPETATASASSERRVVPQSVISRQLANPFLVPDFSAVPQLTSRPRRLDRAPGSTDGRRTRPEARLRPTVAGHAVRMVLCDHLRHTAHF